MIAAVALDALVELVWVAIVATIVLSASTSVCVLGVTRAGELRKAGDGAGAVRYMALAGAGALTVAAGVVFALVVIISG
jgi:hypothetical protein